MVELSVRIQDLPLHGTWLVSPVELLRYLVVAIVGRFDLIGSLVVDQWVLVEDILT